MNKYNFTEQDVLYKVVEIGNRFPDFVYRDQDSTYDDCSYLGSSRNDSLDNYSGQGCIVGQALRTFGVTREDLHKVEGTSATYAVNYLLGHGQDYRVQFNHPLEKIQSRQDEGMSWGEAVSSYTKGKTND